MDKRYKAVVKNIPLNSRIREEGLTSEFYEIKATLIGKEIEVRKYGDLSNWFLTTKAGFLIFHRTWLENPK